MRNNIGVIIFRHYFLTLSTTEKYLQLMLPVILAIPFYFLSCCFSKDASDSFFSMIANVLAILIGFSFTALTILTTTDNTHIKTLKDEPSDTVIGQKRISLYQVDYISFSFILISEALALIATIIFSSLNQISTLTWNSIMLTLLFILILHCIFLTISNTLRLYAIFFRSV